MVLNNKYGLNEVIFSAAFYCLAILPSSISMLLGASSIRAGITISILVFLVLRSPFSPKIFINSKLFLINLTVFCLIVLFYLGSLFFFVGQDEYRFVGSLLCLLFFSLTALLIIPQFDNINDIVFHKIVLNGFYILITIGFVSVVLINKGIVNNKSMLLFTEPSHYAITLMPFLFYVVYVGKRMGVFYLIIVIALSFFVQNLTLMVGSLLVASIVYFRRIWLFLSFMSIIIFLISFVDMSYFLDRVNLSNINNLSVLVFLSGWERAYLSFIHSFGLGLGFQQLGIVGDMGEYQVLIIKILGNGTGLNQFDGGSLGSKLIAEFGVLGVFFIMTYFFYAYKIFMGVSKHEVRSAKNIYFQGVFLMFSIELFVRGMGYFSLTSFLFLSSIYWIYRLRMVQRFY